MSEPDVDVPMGAKKSLSRKLAVIQCLLVFCAVVPIGVFAATNWALQQGVQDEIRGLLKSGLLDPTRFEDRYRRWGGSVGEGFWRSSQDVNFPLGFAFLLALVAAIVPLAAATLVGRAQRLLGVSKLDA